MSRNIYQTITERFVAQLKSGTVPWQKPWLGVQNIVARKDVIRIPASSTFHSHDNSAAYLASWIAKLENDPRLIVSAASQAQRSTDFVMGIQQKEGLVESQLSPEGMPLTWARENGIDTRIPGFAHRDSDEDGTSNLMEWKHGTKPNDRLSMPCKQRMSL
jgi:hypothetical protein